MPEMENRAAGGGAKPELIRKLGYMETFHSALHLVGQYATTALTCSYVIPHNLAGPDDQHILEGALDSAVARAVLDHPILQAAQVGENSKQPSWIELSNIDLANHVDWRVVTTPEDFEGTFDSILQIQLDSKFTHLDTRPGWRITVVRQEGMAHMDVIFAWHHSHTDGMGARLFHEDILRKLNTPPSDGDPPAIKDRVVKLRGAGQKFPPPQEKLGEYRLTAGYVVSTLWKELKPPVLVGKSHIAANWAPIQTQPMRTRLCSLSIDNATLQKLLAACRAHNTSLTGLFHEIIFISLAARLTEEQAIGLGSTTVQNMRPYGTVKPGQPPWLEPGRMICNNVSTMGHKFGVKEVAAARKAIEAASSEADLKPSLAETVWSAAAHVKKEISNRADLGTTNKETKLMGFVSDWRVYFKDLLRKPRNNSWVVSNLGAIDGKGEKVDEGAGWGIRRARFSLSMTVANSTINVCVATVKGGELCADITWQECIMDVKIGEGVATDLESWLRHLGE